MYPEVRKSFNIEALFGCLITTTFGEKISSSSYFLKVVIPFYGTVSVLQNEFIGLIHKRMQDDYQVEKDVEFAATRRVLNSDDYTKNKAQEMKCLHT